MIHPLREQVLVQLIQEGERKVGSIITPGKPAAVRATVLDVGDGVCRISKADIAIMRRNNSAVEVFIEGLTETYLVHSNDVLAIDRESDLERYERIEKFRKDIANDTLPPIPPVADTAPVDGPGPDEDQYYPCPD